MKNKEIIHQLFVIKNLLSRAEKKEVFREVGLTVGLYEILLLIKDEDIKTITQLKEHLTESLPSLTQKTKKLEKLKFLKKEKVILGQGDSRKTSLKVTDLGKKALKRVGRKIEVVSSIMFSRYSKKEREDFLKVLKDLEKFLTKRLKN